jgi:hypothetical protein
MAMLMIGIINELLQQVEKRGKSSTTEVLSYFLCQGTDSRLNTATAILRGTVAPLYKNIGHKNNLVWKNIFSRRENFVSNLRIISFPRIFLGIIDLFL